MVSQLILEGQHFWNTALVHELFDPEEPKPFYQYLFL